MAEIGVIEEKLKNIKINKVNKCPEYILNATRRYYNKKKEDPEFVAKERERLRKYREDNREHVNELARIRKQKKKALERSMKEESMTLMV